jgi:hypothetical protein
MMAIFVLMHKTEDNMEKVVYKFGPDENTMGIIEFNKIRREFSIRKKVSDDASINMAYERWAAEKITKIMYREGGIFPDIASVEK